ncbi:MULTISPECIES: LysR family transcriptional regulator [unclassified Roseovarius]|uniref:LysR family transcriptional regulator n=1 Tax=unclassified Roseovarius TaxID=2614913 RepID=UPI00273DDC1F|nr:MULTISPECIES: LysR family transcriptional regulator [unclassified Roseovarius]
MNWDDLRILLALVRSGSLTRASLMLGIDQSTVGRRLSALEAALGATLFLRSKSGLIPTETGEKLIADATEIERRTDHIAEIAATPVTEPVGELRVMGDHWVLDQLADRFLPRFLDQHPKVNVRLSAGKPSFAAWTAATVSLWFEDPPQMGEFAIKLTDVPFALYAAQGANPCALPWVAMLDDTASRRIPAKFLDTLRQGDEPIRFTGDDPNFLRRAIRHGLGKGVLPVCLAEGDPQLQRVGGQELQVLRPLHLHAHPDTVQSLRVQTTIRSLREAAPNLFCTPQKKGEAPMSLPATPAPHSA